MRTIIPQPLSLLAHALPAPLYVVGGSVRNFLANLNSDDRDWDICAPMSADEFSRFAKKQGFHVLAVYKNTGTVKLRDQNGVDYEYSAFRSDVYVRGMHVPTEIFFTDDILLDAKRRDFTANAVYYDIAADRFQDPLDGISAIYQKRFTTVVPAEKVFGEDGLRLMRLARQSAQTGFSPDVACLTGATKNAALISDISAERIWTELRSILHADEKYGNTDGPYQGLSLLATTGVLRYILPELYEGKGMLQRADFHKYDVLEHSLRAVKYARSDIRLAALLHDVGKPFCMNKDGNFHRHHQEGALLATTILQRLKVPKKLIQRIPALIEWHMYDLDCKTSENKLRRFFVTHFDILDELLALKQADFSACTDDLSIAPTCQKWQALLDVMQRENVPFTFKQLAVTGADLLQIGIPPQCVADTLHKLLLHTAVYPAENTKERLLRLAPSLQRA